MWPLFSVLAQRWTDGMIRALQGFSRSLPDPFPLGEDPPPVTPYQMI